MFEKWIENLLQSILGQYIDGLDQQSLKVGIWSGDAKIENLRLKTDALLKLDIPFIVKYSKLGTLNLNIPWKNLAGAPLKANLDTLYMILSPQQQSEWQFGNISAADKLLEIDNFKKKLLERLQNKDQQDGMMQRIVIRVIENLQVKINNIHIRIEDGSTSYGFILQNFSLLTVNEKGVEQFTDRTANKNQFLIKTLQISNIGLYWQSNNSIKYDEGKFLDEVPQKDYLFRMSLQSKVVQPPKSSEGLPDYKFDIELESFDILFSKPQVQQILNLVDYMNQHNRAKILFQKNQQQIIPLDEENKQKLEKIFRSVPLEKKVSDSINKESKKELDTILDRASIDEVKPLVLSIVKDQQYEDMKQKALKKKQPQQGFLGGWFGRNKQQQQNETPTLLAGEEEEITQFLEENFQMEENQANVKPKSIQCTGKLRQGTISLNNPRKQEVDEFTILFQDLQCDLKMERDLKLQLSLIDMKVLFNQQQFLTNMSDEKTQPIFFLNFNLIESTNTQIELITRSSKLRFVPDVITVLQDFSNVEVKNNQLKQIADDQIQELKQNAQVALANQVIAEQNRWVNITMNQFYLEIPLPNSQESWVFCPGLATIKSSIENTQEKYTIKISDINLMHQSVTDYAVIDNFCIEVNLLLPNSINPNMKIYANVDDIVTNLDPLIYQKLTQIGDCFAPTLTVENSKQKSVDAETEKNNLVQSALKIGPLYLKEGQLNQWVKFTCVLSGSYLYFYSTPKALQPTYIIYVKNSQIIQQGTDEFKMNILLIENEATQSFVGVMNKGQINSWVDNINSLKDKEEQLLNQLNQKKDEKVQPIEYEKIITFRIQKVCVNLQDSNRKQFLQLQTSELNLKLTVHPQIIQAHITLQNIILKDCLRVYANQELQNLMISESDNSELIEIHYIQIERTNPDYKNIDKQIDLVFGNFKINFKSESFAYLMQFISNDTTDEQQQQQLENQDKEFIEAEKEYVLLKLGVKINSITFNVVHEITKLSFFDIRFENSNIIMLKMQDELDMEIKLGNLQLNDLSNYPNTLTFEEDFKSIQPSQIIGIKEQGESLLEVKIIIIEPLSKKGQANRNLLNVNAKISSIVADYQQQPVLRIIDYLQTLQEPFTNSFSFKVPGFSIDRVVRQKQITKKIQVEPQLEESQKIIQDPPQMRINVSISNPQIIIRNKFQNEFILFNLGNIAVTNEKNLVNEFYKETYKISITQLNLTGHLENNKKVIASDFNFNLIVTLPDLIPFYKSLNMKPSETIEIDSEMSQFILNVDGSSFKLINRLVAYNFTLNDSFNEFVLLNTDKSNQISQEEQKIILKQDVEKKIRSAEYFVKFNLKINNISIFLCLDRPLMRLSIVESKVTFNMKKDNKKELYVQINSFNSCVYELANGCYVSKPLIGIQAETKYDSLEDLAKLIPNQYFQSKESGQIEMFINPTANKVHNKIYLKFESLLITIQTKILLQALTIFETQELEPYVNKALLIYQQKYDEFVKTSQKEEELQPTDNQIFITLGDVIIALPSKNDSVLILTGKFNVILNQYDTMSLDELLQIIKQQGLNEFDLHGMNFKQKSTVSIEGVQAFVASKQWLYNPVNDQNKNQRQLICPFTMLLNHTAQLVISEDFDSLTERQEVRLSLSQFSFKMAFQDILFIQSQVNSQLSIINELAKNDISQQKIQTKQQNQNQQILSLQLVFDGVEICILNDIENYYQYILNFKLFQNDVKIEQLHKSLKFTANLPLQLTYFNSNIGQWEPVLEKIDININYQKVAQQQNLKDYEEINVQIKDNVNFNVSTQLVQTIVPTLNILMEQLQVENKNIRCVQTSQEKYALYNQFGSDIICETNDNNFIIAYHNEYKPFDVVQQKTYSYVKLQIQGEKYPFEVDGWNIDKIQSRVHTTKEDQKVLLQNFVDPVRNSKIVYVSSEFIFQNATQTQLDIVFQNIQGQQYKYNLQTFVQNSNQITTQPYQLVLPSFLCQKDFYICKSSNPKEKSQSYNMKYLKQCLQSGEVLKLWLSEKFLVFLNARKDPQFQGRIIIYIQPYFRLQNMLPFPVKITTLFETKMGGTYELKPLEYLDEHQYQNIKESHAIQIEIDSYKKSMPIPLLNNRNFKQQQNIVNLIGEEWQGSNGGKSELVLEYNYGVFDKTGLCNATLYAQELLKNETQYELVVFQGRNGQQSTIGGLKKGSKNRMLILNNSTVNNELMFSERDTPQVYSLTTAQINSIGISVSNIIFRRNGLFYIAPLSVQSELKFIQQTCQKVVTVRNRIIVVNDSNMTACIKQNLAAKAINPNERLPLEICFGDEFPQNVDKIYNLKFTFIDEYEWTWSGGIECDQIGVYYFQLRSQKFPSIRKFAQVDINEKNGVLFVVLSETNQEKTPYKITNSSNLVEITVLNIPAELDTGNECYFAWDDPNQKNTVDLQIRCKIQNFEAISYSLNINKISEAKFFILSPLNKQDPHKVYIKLIVELDGYTRHAQFLDSSEEEIKKYKEGENNKQPLPQQQMFKFDIMINQINLNLIDNHKNSPQEIVNIILYQSEAIILISQQNKGVFQFKISGLQIDNTTQLFPQFPVILTLQPTGKIKQQFPILNILVQMNLKAKQLQMIDKMSIETNRLALRINEEFIKTLLSTTNKITQILNDQQQKIIVQNFDWKKCELPDKLIPTYFGSFSIYPINLSITVQWGERKKDKDQESFLLTSALSGVGFQLVSVDEAEINLKGINLENVFDSVNGLSKRIVSCYLPNLYNQLPAILGSLSVIGNPAKLLKNFASGIQDLVERPIEGFTKGPLEGGMGIVSGASSLVSNTVSGVFNSVKNVVGTISSGLTKVTMDQTYQQERQVQNQQQAQNVGSGIAEGSKSLAKGVAGGVFGFFAKPVQGLQQGGASGFIKGVWQGTSGLVIKPVTGVLDVITKTSEGVKNQLSSDEQASNNRIRYLRPFYESDGYFKEYNWIDAECFEVIQGIKKGKYSHHKLIRVILIDKDNKQFGLILTDLSMILFDLTKHIKLWSIKYCDIQAIDVNNQVMLIKINSYKKAFGGKSITYLTFASSQITKQIAEEIKLLRYQ